MAGLVYAWQLFRADNAVANIHQVYRPATTGLSDFYNVWYVIVLQLCLQVVLQAKTLN